MRFSNISVQSWKSTRDWNSPPRVKARTRALPLVLCEQPPVSLTGAHV